jgi:hypothetical protein
MKKERKFYKKAQIFNKIRRENRISSRNTIIKVMKTNA